MARFCSIESAAAAAAARTLRGAMLNLVLVPHHKGPGLKYGFFPRIIQTKIFWKNNLDMTQKGVAKYGGRGPKMAFVINGQSSNFFVWR
jgi:hypothetical protein